MSRRGSVSLFMIVLALVSWGCGGDEGEESGELEQAESTSLAIQKLMEGVAPETEVVTSATGLQYVDLALGEGEAPRSGQICSTHATLWLMDGTRIWSSRDPDAQGQVNPFDFRIGRGGVIPGWEEGVASMKPGGQRRLAVPPELGYGEQGKAPVPPNATLIFEIELMEVRD